MMNKDILEVQQMLIGGGFNVGKAGADGLYGPSTREALRQCIAKATTGGAASPTTPIVSTGDSYDLAWSAKVTPEFCRKVEHMAQALLLPADGANNFMACMAFETGETFSPSIQNGAGAPYHGLIQFGADAAIDLKTTTDALRKMSAFDQLDYVYEFFRPYAGKLKTLSDIYMRILWPRAVGQPESYELWNKVSRPTTYLQNRGLDIDKNGSITKAEAAQMVTAKLTRGMQPQFRRKLT